jgi:hypothetical protein
MKPTNMKPIIHQIIILPFVLFFYQITQSTSFTLSTTSTIKGISSARLHDFLATPSNWPRIVASSHSVKPSTSKSNRVDVPLQVGDEVEEVFGLPPLLPLSVVWKCIESSPPSPPSLSSLSTKGGRGGGKGLFSRNGNGSSNNDGRLEFYSANGVRNLAKDCYMKFFIEDVSDGENENDTNANATTDACKVTLDMEFDPVLPLLVMGATPLLKLDNDLALKVLLPAAIKR